MRKTKGGSGKRKHDSRKAEEFWKLTSLQIIKYYDHVLYRNTSPKTNKLSERVTIGFLLRETEDYVEICWDLPTWLQKNEVCDKMSGIKIMKNSIIERYWLE
ncbi:MAG: hypothetical protein ACTSQY_07910 [Candidatus Odinarchaeia archaeon]